MFKFLITFLITFIGMAGIYNYVPLRYFEILKNNQSRLGSSLTTIQSTDTLKNSRITINDNFTALNNGKIENSTTTLPLITTLSGLTSAASLATVGTITSGTWSGTAILTAKGGTGSTTLASNQVLLGNGTGNIGIVAGLGTTGQYLTSNGAGSAPTWQTSAVDQAINYTWTGNHLWSGAASTSLLAVLNTLYVGTTATSTIQGSTSGTSQMQGYLNVLGSSGTSTVSSNLVVSNNASTTNLTVSGTCVGCLSGYEKITATAGLSTSDNGDTSATASCTAGKNVVGGGLGIGGGQTGYRAMENYPSSNTAWFGLVRCYSIALGTCNAGTLTVYAICAKP